MSKDGQKFSIPRLLKVMDSPRCNNSDIDRYMTMPTYLPPVDHKGETLLELSEEEDAILEPTFPTRDNQFPH